MNVASHSRCGLRRARDRMKRRKILMKMKKHMLAAAVLAATLLVHAGGYPAV